MYARCTANYENPPFSIQTSRMIIPDAPNHLHRKKLQTKDITPSRTKYASNECSRNEFQWKRNRGRSAHLVPSPEVHSTTAGRGGGGFMDLRGGQEMEAHAGESIARRRTGAQVAKQLAGAQIPHCDARIHRWAHHHDFSYGRQLAPSTHGPTAVPLPNFLVTMLQCSSSASSSSPSHFPSGYSCLLRRYRPREFFATVTTTIQLFSLDIQMARIIIPQAHSHDRLTFKFCRLCTNVCKLCDVDGDDVHFSSLNDGGGSTYTSLSNLCFHT